MNVLSLFSGIGGLDLGLERAGMTVVGQVEIDPWCRQILAKHWPEVPRHDDVRTAAEWWLGQPRPVVDLVCGGVPCQPVSIAGRKLAQDDERWLWPVTIDAIGVLRPRYALLENVPGLLVRGMGDVLGQLAEVGYDARWDCVSASAVGAPHQRDRVWIIAYPSGHKLREQSVTEPRRDCPPLAGVDGPASPLADSEGQRSELWPTEGERQGRPSGCGPAMADATGRSAEVSDASVSRSPDGPGETRQSVVAESERLGGQVADADSLGFDRRRRAMECHPEHAHNLRTGTRWPAPTRDPWWSTEPDVGRVAHGIPRRVDRLRGLGNAVVPQVAEHIGRLIMNAERAS